MKRFKYIYAIIVALIICGCEQEPQPNKNNKLVEFTLRTSDVFYDSAIIYVKHNGPEDITWYGFVTDDMKTKENQLYISKRRELQKMDKIEGLKKENERNVLLENLKENTKYRYIVFGIKENGSSYDNVGFACMEFETSQNIYLMTQTEEWKFNYLGRTADGQKEKIEVISEGGIYRWDYVSKESIEEFNKEYPDGFEIWDENDIYMATVNGTELFSLNQISSIQLYITQGGYKLSELTYNSSDVFEIDRLGSGEYYLIAYGFNSDGSHTQTYSVQELKIEEEAAEEGYTKWLGNFTFSGEVDVTKEDGEITKETRTYNMMIEKYDNNFMYRVHGWECGDDVEYDWEEDITQIDKEKGQFLAFPAYYKNGNLVIKEEPMTYITFDGSTVMTLGIYGYLFDKKYDDHIPVLFDGQPMAIAEPIADGQTTTVLNGQDAKYEYIDENGEDQVLEWTYSKMGYIAYSYNEDLKTNVWQAINPAMNFPITITRTETTSTNASKIQTGCAKEISAIRLFDNKKISADFLKKDFRPISQPKPAFIK